MTARDRLILIVLASVGVIAAAWILAVAPRRQQAQSLSAKVASAQSQLSSLQGELTQRQQIKQQFNQNYAELTSLGEAVPADQDVPSLLFQIQTAAKATGVSFQTMNVGAATPSSGTPPAAGSAPAPAGSSTSTPSSATPSGSSPTTAGAAAVGSAALSPQTFNFTFQGNFFHLGEFFNELEHGVTIEGPLLAVSGRLITLNSITLQAGSSFPQITANVQATAYTVPAAQGLLDGATAAGPAQDQTVSAAAAPQAGVATPTAVIVR